MSHLKTAYELGAAKALSDMDVLTKTALSDQHTRDIVTALLGPVGAAIANPSGQRMAGAGGALAGGLLGNVVGAIPGAALGALAHNPKLGLILGSLAGGKAGGVIGRRLATDEGLLDRMG